MQIRDVWKLYHPMIEEEIERGKHPNLEKYLQILSYKRRGKGAITRRKEKRFRKQVLRRARLN